MEIRGVDFIVHYVPNLEEAVLFYRDTLCLKLELHNPAWNWAEFSAVPNYIGSVWHLSGRTAKERQRRGRGLPWL